MSLRPSPLSAHSPVAMLLAERFPPLARYWPNLQTVSRQQAAFLLLDQLEAFYGGSVGGGKSDALLAAALQYVDRPGYHALILRRTLAELALPGAVMARSHEWLAAKPEVRWNDDKKTWSFPSGASLTFGYAEALRDIYRYQGSDWLFVGWDELTQFPPEPYEYMFSRVRRNAGSKIPLRVRSAANPGGVGHTWVLDRFPIAEGRTPAEAGGRIFVPARLWDNPGLDADEYVLSLRELDPVLRAQLLDGDWGAFQGAAFQIRPEHLIDEFPLEDSFERFEAADYGLNGAPWAMIPVDYEGNLVFYDMVYVADTLPSDLAQLVLEKRELGWGHGNHAFIDPSVWHRTGQRDKWGAPAVLADEFTDSGVLVQPANNDPRAGLIRIRELLQPDPERVFPNWHPRSGEGGCPRVFFHRERCSRLVEELRSAPLQPIEKVDAGEKIDPQWESRYGHAVAMARYAVLTRPAPSTEPEQVPDDPRARLMYLNEKRFRERTLPRNGGLINV